MGRMRLVRRGGRALLALPPTRAASLHALRLYQPQRPAAKVMAVCLRWLIWGGGHRLLPAVEITRTATVEGKSGGHGRPFPGSVGLMFGSPEHLVKRAIATYQTEHGWEVAKIAFGSGGREVIDMEVAVLAALSGSVRGLPALLGSSLGEEVSLLRLPRYEGASLRMADAATDRDAVALLTSWLGNMPAKPITEFTEWQFIHAALAELPGGAAALDQLAAEKLTPVVRHGDFSRWNLLRLANGELLALDWEWGAVAGLPGTDLVHYFAQDARLVRRLPTLEALRATAAALARGECQEYLGQTGWQGGAAAVMLASLALTVGACQQDNGELLLTWLKTMAAGSAKAANERKQDGR